MTFEFKITEDRSNKDIPPKFRAAPKQAYLDLYESLGPKNFKPKLKDPPVETWDNRQVVRCDLISLGFKALAAERLIASTKAKTLVYCAPRVGHAPLAIAALAKMYGKKAVFFAPASAHASTHQLCTLALGAELRFVRIAAMPVLNQYARKWAAEHDAEFLPFGLANIPAVTAGIVALADRLAKQYGEPKEFWCATSTGTMIRGLQIGWPKAKPRTIAVARNIHPGEIGRAAITSATVPFLRRASIQPPFPTTANYDAKAWGPCLEHGRKGAWFINVGRDAHIDEIASAINPDSVNADRAWGDFSDLQ